MTGFLTLNKMKKIITIILLLICINVNAQSRPKVSYSKDNTGVVMSISGIIFSTIALTVSDGSEMTWKNTGPYMQQRVYKPWYQNPSRLVMFTAGITLTIGGGIYHKNKR